MATVGLGFWGGTGAAHADGPTKPAAFTGSTTVQQPGQGTVIGRQVIRTGATHQTLVGSTNVKVTAAPTGDGPANAAECDRWAGLINELNQMAVDGANRNSSDADSYLKQANEAEDQAMDRGCFISYG